MSNFKEFIGKKTRSTKRELNILEKIFKLNGFSTQNFIEENSEDAYIFVKSNTKELPFGGIRIYKIGEHISFRIQNSEKTHPYGKAYKIPIEDLWNEIMTEDLNEEAAANEIMKLITKEIKDFFSKNVNALNDLKAINISGKNANGMLISGQGFETDYANLISNNKF